MRHCSFLAALFLRRCSVAHYGSLATVDDQPLTSVLAGWSWSQSWVDVVDHEPVVTFAARPAQFGDHITEEPGLPGYLIPMSSRASQCPSVSPLFELSVKADGDQDVDFPLENFGCPPICRDKPPSPKLPPISENWIALIQRGECPFVEKVRAAQALGAKGVIIGGWKVAEGEKDELLNMYSPLDAADVKIPSVYVTYKSYDHLWHLILASNTTTSGLQTISVIMRAEESWGWLSPLVTFVMLLILPSLLTFLTLVIHRLREARRERLDRAPEDVVKHLPTRIWSGKGWEKESDWFKNLRRRAQNAQRAPGSDEPLKESSCDLESQREFEDPSKPAEECDENISLAASATSRACRRHSVSAGYGSTDQDDIPGVHQPWFEGQSECAICLSSFDEGDKVRILPCGHLFHVEEVDGWLLHRKKLCPICKLDVTLPTAGVSPSSGVVGVTDPAANERDPTVADADGLGAIRRLRDWMQASRPPPMHVRVPFLSRARRRSHSTPTTLEQNGDANASPQAPSRSTLTERTALLVTDRS